jgi:hypothetical protein
MVFQPYGKLLVGDTEEKQHKNNNQRDDESQIVEHQHHNSFYLNTLRIDYE